MGSAGDTFRGGAYFGEQRAFGPVVVEPDGIRFEGGGLSAQLPMDGLELKAGGANNKMLFFTHPDFPEWTIHTSDHAILNHPALKDVEGLAERISGIRRAKSSANLVLASALSLMILFVVGLFALKEPMVAVVSNRVPVTWEQKLGDAAFAQIESQTAFVEDPELLAELNRMARPLLEALPEQPYEFRFHIARDDQINAFALPGGNIVFNSGMLLAAGTPEEVVGVLAHEIAHVTHRHSIRQLVSTVGLFAVIQAFFGDATGLMAVLVDNSAYLLTQKYSRDYEREADASGWDYLVAAEIDPRGMIRFFERLQEKEEKLEAATGGALRFLSTHPATVERIETLYQRWERTDAKDRFQAIPIDFEGFQERLAEVVD